MNANIHTCTHVDKRKQRPVETRSGIQRRVIHQMILISGEVALMCVSKPKTNKFDMLMCQSVNWTCREF